MKEDKNFEPPEDSEIILKALCELKGTSFSLFMARNLANEILEIISELK